MTAADVKAALGMQPHPEGGSFVETWRDRSAAAPERGHSTAIYFLLEAGEASHWHRVRDAGEVWHFYRGAPLAMELCAPDSGDVKHHVLGPDLAAGERPQVGCCSVNETEAAVCGAHACCSVRHGLQWPGTRCTVRESGAGSKAVAAAQGAGRF